MKYSADLHIHTVLSPCGDLTMSPAAIIDRARELKLDIIGITDHNSTRQSMLVREIGERSGIKVFTGAEVTTKEEVHCLVFFDLPSELNAFQKFLDEKLPDIKNDPNRFGYQVVVNFLNEIIYTEEKLLISALPVSIDELGAIVHQLNGIFIPAHIDRMRFGLLGQLGFLPHDLSVDALEISPNCNIEKIVNTNPEVKNHTLIQGSDAHYLPDLGKCSTILEMSSKEFQEFKKTLNLNGQKNIELSTKL